MQQIPRSGVTTYKIDLAAFDYPLPETAIARFPLKQRDASKLLVADPNSQQIIHDRFRYIDRYIPAGALLVRNVSRVIPARLFFHKPTGGKVEIFCLEPLSTSSIDPSVALSTVRRSRWRCLVRGKHIVAGSVLRMDDPVAVEARVLERSGREATVEFQWEAPLKFGEILQRAGHMPIPPYLRREDQPLDRQRYQTVYATAAGSVAAPTAGLHFTRRVLQRLQQKGVAIADVVLHVGAGTFLPIRSERVTEHQMHREQGAISIQTLEQLRQALRSHRPIIAVGTTTLRLLESLYWIGTLLFDDSLTTESLMVPQQLPYDVPSTVDPQEALAAIVAYLQNRNQTTLHFQTQLFVLPGYRFRFVQGLVTNFHQPRSTLLLLVAAFVGPFWRTIYQEALQRQYRFLSYGDSSLLWRLQESGVERTRGQEKLW